MILIYYSLEYSDRVQRDRIIYNINTCIYGMFYSCITDTWETFSMKYDSHKTIIHFEHSILNLRTKKKGHNLKGTLFKFKAGSHAIPEPCP